MYTFLIILIIFIATLPLWRRLLTRLIYWGAQRYMRKKMQQSFGNFASAGTSSSGRERSSSSKRSSGNRRRRKSAYHEGPIIPREYAEDVEFTEFKDFSETEIISSSNGSETEYHESQVSDVEYIEIKEKKSR